MAIGVDSFGDDWGPSSFWVDKDGCIYISDSLNGKIKKFSKDGKLIFATERKFYVGSFVVDDKGNIFVSTDVLNRTTKFDNNGRFIYHIPYNLADEIDCPEKARKAPPLEATEIPSFKRPALINSQGRRAEVRYEGYDEKGTPKTIVNTFDKQGNNTGSFTICIQEKKQQLQAPSKDASMQINFPNYERLTTQGISVKWIDDEENLYGSSRKKRDKPIVLKNIPVAPPEGVFDFTINYDDITYKYNSKGEFITQISYPSPSWGVDEGNISVDKNGNIYCLQSHKDGMDVVKYEWKPIK